MAKIPHLDFPLRDKIDGTEEIYTQNIAYDPKEQKFTVDALKDHILQSINAESIGTKGESVYYSKVNNTLQFRNITGDFFVGVKSDENNVYLNTDPVRIGNNISLDDLKNIPTPTTSNVILQWNGSAYTWTSESGTTPPAVNGLNLNNGNYQLGGELLDNTNIDVKNFEFGVGKNNVRLNISESNPYWINGNEASFLETKNTDTDTESYMGVTNSNFGSFSHIWSKKNKDGSFAYLQQNWAGTFLKTQNATTNTFTEMNISSTGSSIQCFENGSTATAGILTIGDQESEYKRVANGSEINLMIKGVSQSSNEMEVLLKGLPIYSNQNNAVADNYPIDGLYRTPNGELKVVIP